MQNESSASTVPPVTSLALRVSKYAPASSLILLATARQCSCCVLSSFLRSPMVCCMRDSSPRASLVCFSLSLRNDFSKLSHAFFNRLISASYRCFGTYKSYSERDQKVSYLRSRV